MQIIKKQVLKAHGYYAKRFISAELTLGRKNMTHHFIKLIRLAIKMMREEEGKSAQLDRFRKKLGEGKVNIRAVTGMFKNEQFSKVIEYFKNRIFREKKMASLILSLDVKTCEKYVMLEMSKGFVYSLNHPEEEFSSWDL